MRHNILKEVVRSYLNDRFADIDNVPSSLIPEDAAPIRGSIARDREIVKEQCLAAMGICPEESDAAAQSLSEFAQTALQRQQLCANKISVIHNACAACMKPQHVVSNMCRGCAARPCMVNCPKKAISFVDGKAHIDTSLCINCGICKESCPYSAIIKAPLPCEDACPVSALSKDDKGKEHIDHEKCVSCGQCLGSCPFGAIVERSQMIDVLRKIKETEQKVVAMVAPAVMGQFAGTINNLVGALKQLGFDDVIEVAVGADVTTQREAAEFVERMEEGQKFMTTSCCPAYFRAAHIHIPELAPYVSSTKTPMYYTAELVKQDNPDCLTVFVGPCLAKRMEAESDPNTDYVITFEELSAIFDAAEIKVAEAPAEELTKISHAQGRIYPISGGVAGAVASLVGDKVELRLERVDGLNKDSMKLLKRYATKGGENNMIEVMTCAGGCVGGPGCIAMAKKAARAVETYSQAGEQLTADSKIG